MSPQHVTTTPLVGRTDELDQLCELVGIPADPRAASILVAGDAGVGKTRLLAELGKRAGAAGWRVLTGHCVDLGDSALPYLPFTEIFGRLEADGTPAPGDTLAAGQLGVRRLLPGQRLSPVHDDAEPGRVDRSDLFESVHAALEQLGAATPTLVIVEDVHWADQSTREMLSFLFARRFGQPVSVIASYRSDDLHRRHPLRATAAEWSRLAQVTVLQLRPLAEAHVRRLVQQLHPAPLREPALHAIVSRAEGNAFFAEELLAALSERLLTANGLDEPTLPWHLADLLLVRLDRLDEASRLVVRAVAAAGRRASHELLTRVIDLNPEALNAAVRDAVESNVLTPVGTEGYGFRHALQAEAVYGDLLPGERVRLHAAYADALSSRDIDGTAAELARHARAAHDLPTAIQASIQAGDDAMSVGGPDEAAHHYEVALELLAERPPEESAGAVAAADIVGLAVKASEAVTAAGHPHRAVALVRDQLTHLPPEASAEDRARLLLALATAALLGETSVDPLDATTEALSLVPDDPPTPLRTKIITAHARANTDRQRDDEAMLWARQALDLGGRLGMSWVVADATTTLARVDRRTGDPEGSKRALEAIVAQARSDGDVMAELRGLHNLGGLHHDGGRLGEALVAYEQAAGRAAEMGRPWAPYAIDARIIAGITAYMAGDWGKAERLADVSGQSPPGLAEALLTAMGLAVAAGHGEVAALARLPHIRSWWDRDGMVPILSGSAAIDLYGDNGDIEAAIRTHDDVVDAVHRAWHHTTFQARIRLSGLLLGQLAAQRAQSVAATAADLVERGDELLEAARLAADQARQDGRTLGPESAAWLARAEAEHTRLRWLTGINSPAEEDLVSCWERAVTEFERLGHVFEAARSQARLAAALRAVGRLADARAVAGRARATAMRLSAQPLLAELRALGAGSAPGRGPARQHRDEMLTPREREILALVAQGRSNSDIARQLYISAKTVSVHVSNILAKLHAASRTEAAAVARRTGLLPD